MIRKSPKPDRFILRVIDKTPKRRKRSKSRSPKEKKDKIRLDRDLEKSRDIVSKLTEPEIINPIELGIIQKGQVGYPIDKYQSKIAVTKTIAIKSPDNISNRTNSSKQMRWSPKNITYTYDPKKSILDSTEEKLSEKKTDIITIKPIYSKLESQIEKNSRPLISPRAQLKIDRFIKDQYSYSENKIINKPIGKPPVKNSIDVYRENSNIAKQLIDNYKKIIVKTCLNNFKSIDPFVIDYSLLDNNIDKLYLFRRLPDPDDKYICLALSNGLTINRYS